MMKRIAAAAAGVMVVAGLAVAEQTDVSGTWNFVVNLDAGSGEPVFVFMQDGEILTGSYEGTFGSASVTGTVMGDRIEFTFGAEGAGPGDVHGADYCRRRGYGRWKAAATTATSAAAAGAPRRPIKDDARGHLLCVASVARQRAMASASCGVTASPSSTSCPDPNG